MSARVVGVARERQIAVLGLVLGPALLVTGLAALNNVDGIQQLIPLSRAEIGWAIAMPLLLLAPAVLSLGWSDEATELAAKWLSRGIAVAILLGVIVSTAATTRYVGCQPVTDPLETVPLGAMLGAFVAAGFFAAVAAGRWFASSERPLAAVIAGTVVATISLGVDLAVFGFTHPGLSCAPRPV